MTVQRHTYSTLRSPLLLSVLFLWLTKQYFKQFGLILNGLVTRLKLIGLQSTQVCTKDCCSGSIRLVTWPPREVWRKRYVAKAQSHRGFARKVYQVITTSL